MTEKEFNEFSKNKNAIMFNLDQNVFKVRFPDNQYFILRKKENEFLIFSDIKLLAIEYIREQFKKRPNYQKLLIQKIKIDEHLTFPFLFLIVGKIKIIIDYQKKNSFERISNWCEYKPLLDLLDTLHRYKNELHYKKWIKKTFYPNEQHLLNKTNIKKMQEIYEDESFNRHLRKTIKKVKNKHEFNELLIRITEESNWNKDYIQEIIYNNDIKIVFENKDLIIIKPDTFEKTRAIAPVLWCVRNNVKHFNEHNLNGGFYIVVNFKKSITNPLNMIGISVNITEYKGILTNKVMRTFSCYGYNKNNIEFEHAFFYLKYINKEFYEKLLKRFNKKIENSNNNLKTYQTLSEIGLYPSNEAIKKMSLKTFKRFVMFQNNNKYSKRCFLRYLFSMDKKKRNYLKDHIIKMRKQHE
jgi:hypothetical protein